MRFAKFAGIWVVGMALIVLVTNLAGVAMAKLLGADSLMLSLTGYSKKMHLPQTVAVTEEEQRQNAAILTVRALMSDQRLSPARSNKLLGMLTFTDMDIDQTTWYYDADGTTPFMHGVFHIVYRQGEEKRKLTDTVGLVDLRAFCETPAAETLIAALDETPDARVRLDSYTQDGYLLTPAKLTLLSADGTTLTSIDCTASGDLQTADDLFVLNSGSNEPFEMNDLRYQLSNAQLPERRCDRRAAALAAQTDAAGEDISATVHPRLGFGHMMVEEVEVTDHTAGVVVGDFDYHRSVLLYIALLGTVLTVLLALIYRAKRSL